MLGKNVASSNFVSGSDVEQNFGVAGFLPGKIWRQEGRGHSPWTRFWRKVGINQFSRSPFSESVPGKNTGTLFLSNIDNYL